MADALLISGYIRLLISAFTGLTIYRKPGALGELITAKAKNENAR